MTYKKYLGGGMVIVGAALVICGIRYFGWDAVKNFFDNGAGGNDTAEISLDDLNDASDTADALAKLSATSSFPEDISADSAVAPPAAKKKTASTLSAVPPTVAAAQNGGTPVINVPSPSCPFPQATASTSHEVIFNEIAWMGMPSSSNAEWMELKNISGAGVNLGGWTLADAAGKIKINFSGSDAIPAAGLFLLSRANGAGKIYSGDLANDGGTLALIDPQCSASDILNAANGWLAGDNATKQTMERDADNSGWHTSTLPGGTPGAENSAGVPIVATSSLGNIFSIPLPLPIPFPAPAPVPVSTPSPPGGSASPSPSPSPLPTSPSPAPPPDMQPPTPAASITITTPTITSPPIATSSSPDTPTTSSGHPLIEAIQIAGASSTNDFVKIYDPAGITIDMSGWKLRKRSSTGADYSLKQFSMGSAIYSGQMFTWANSAGGYSEAIGANVSSTETLSADNSVALIDASGTVIDAVAWGTGTGQYGEGNPYPTNPVANQQLTRNVSGGVLVDTENNASDFVLQ